MRAEEEAKLAREQLVATQNEIGTAVAAVQKVDGALAGIATGVGEVHKLLGTMASDNQAQATAVTEISSAVATMDQATQKNAAMVEETSAASRTLSNEVTALVRQAARFKVAGEDARGALIRARHFASVH
jgi:methyl-accepting chemotaxis protein